MVLAQAPRIQPACAGCGSEGGSDLLTDAEKILDHLGISKVHLSGGSWGSTLGLLFALSHPERAQSLTINGVFAASRDEIDWLDKGIFKSHYPEVWQRFVESVPEKYRDDPADYQYQALESHNGPKLNAASKALSDLETPILMFDWRGLDRNIKKDQDADSTDEFDPVPYKIYGHYFKNSCFLTHNYITKNAHMITVPTFIVQGRYDMACPPITAYEIHNKIAGSKLYMTLSSHGNDPETNTALKVIRDFLY